MSGLFFARRAVQLQLIRSSSIHIGFGRGIRYFSSGSFSALTPNNTPPSNISSGEIDNISISSSKDVKSLSNATLKKTGSSNSKSRSSSNSNNKDSEFLLRIQNDPKFHMALFDFVYDQGNHILFGYQKLLFFRHKLGIDLGLTSDEQADFKLNYIASKYNSHKKYENQRGTLKWVKDDPTHPHGYLKASLFAPSSSPYLASTVLDGHALAHAEVHVPAQAQADVIETKSNANSRRNSSSSISKDIKQNSNNSSNNSISGNVSPLAIANSATANTSTTTTAVVPSFQPTPTRYSSKSASDFSLENTSSQRVPLSSDNIKNNIKNNSSISNNSKPENSVSSASKAVSKAPNSYVKTPRPIITPRNNKDPAYLKQVIQDSRLQGKKSAILWAISTARMEKIRLETKDYVEGLKACTETYDERCTEAFWIYEVLSKEKVLPIEVFKRVMRVCANRGDGAFALRLMDDFKSMEFHPDPTFLSDLLVSLGRSESPEYVRTIERFYDKYLQVCNDNDVNPNPMVLQEIALYFSLKSESELLMKILEKMTELEIEPSVTFCSSLLDNALECCDSRSVAVMGNWFSKIFDVKLSRGTLTRMMEVACYNGSPELAKICVQLHNKAEVPLSPLSAYSWALACIRAPFFFPIIEALLECQLRGIDLYNEYTLEESEIRDLDVNTMNKIGLENFQLNKKLMSQSLGERLYVAMAERLSQTRTQQDEFYYSLVDLVRADVKVPKVLLDAIVLAPAYHSYSNKSFATFQEYKSLFCLEPDVHSYNGLMTAVAFNKYTEVHDMFKILQQMEREKISPNVMTFSILFEFLADRNEFSIIESTLQHTITQGILPDRRSSTKLVKALRMGSNSSHCYISSSSSSSSSHSGASSSENKSSSVAGNDPVYEPLIKTVSQLADIRIQILGNPASSHVFPDKRQAEARRHPVHVRTGRNSAKSEPPSGGSGDGDNSGCSNDKNNIVNVASN